MGPNVPQNFFSVEQIYPLRHRDPNYLLLYIDYKIMLGEYDYQNRNVILIDLT